MAYNIGLNVIEVDGAGAPAIVGAAVSVGAFNILTARGVPNRPVRVSSYPQFAEQFGGPFPGGLGAYLVRGFFENGGRTAYINRVTAAEAPVASLKLRDGGTPARDTLLLEAGFRGLRDPGAWGSRLLASVTANTAVRSRLRETAPATVAGTDIAAAVNMSALPALALRIDGQTTATELRFQPSDFADPAQATRAEIRDAINRQTRDLVASLADNHLVLTSTGEVARRRQDWSSLQVTAANATLGFTAGAQPTRGTVAARSTTGSQLANADAFEVGDAIAISDGQRNATAKIVRLSPSGEVEWAPAIANINTFDGFDTTVTAVRFDLSVLRAGDGSVDVVETLADLSIEPESSRHVVKVVNDALRGSRYVVASDLRSSSAPGANAPRAVEATRFAQVRDSVPTAADFMGDAAAHTGFHAFDPADVQLVTCERDDRAIAAAGLAYCAARGDCLYVGSVPEGSVGGGTAGDYGRGFQGKKVYGALYGPWVKVTDPLATGANPTRYVPPAGHVMGVFARVETTRGIWKAPAGDEANLLGVFDVEHQLSDADHTDLVKNAGVNGIRMIPGAGIVVDASRTLSTDTRWLYVNVRLLFNFVKSSLKRGLRWVRQEPNKDTLWDAIKYSAVTPFLMGLWRQGAFGTGKPEEVFTVICDASNNPPSEVEQGNLKVEVYFYPSRPAETIVIVVGQQPSGASTGER
jgi:hypothetical protein